MLAPVTTANSGRLPASLQPVSTPAPKAPSEPPPEMASQGPLTCGSTREKSFSESPQTRASGMPGTTAASWSSSVNATRGWSFCASWIGFRGGFLRPCGFLSSATVWACAKAHSSGGNATIAVQISSPAKPA
jgi:hypothetical protein